MAPLRTVLVLGANGYIGNAVARAFVRNSWITYGLIRSPTGANALASEEILPVIGSIDDADSYDQIKSQIRSSTIDVIVSTTEDLGNYVGHYHNIVALLRTLSSYSLSNGTRPLVIFTSGCKDYGIGPHYATDPALSPHTETSPINPPSILALRAEYSSKIFEHGDSFSSVLVRPTNVHGRPSSFYGLLFEAAAQAAEADKPLVVTTRPDSICHCLHVDDCGEAYVAIASHARRGDVEGQVFNISARRYETVEELGRALVVEYGLQNGIQYVEEAAQLGPGDIPLVPGLVDFPQWTGSDKLRQLTGWGDHRPLFTEALHVYRVAYEASKETGHENIRKINSTIVRIAKSTQGLGQGQ